MYLIHILPSFPKSRALQFNYTKNISECFVCGCGWKSGFLLWGIQGGCRQHPRGSAAFQEWYARLYSHSSLKTVKSVERLPLKGRILLGILPHISQQLQFPQQNSGTVVLHRGTCKPASQQAPPCRLLSPAWDRAPCHEEGWYSRFKANKRPPNQSNVRSNSMYWLGWTILVSVLLGSHVYHSLAQHLWASVSLSIERQSKAVEWLH